MRNGPTCNAEAHRLDCIPSLETNLYLPLQWEGLNNGELFTFIIFYNLRGQASHDGLVVLWVKKDCCTMGCSQAYYKDYYL